MMPDPPDEALLELGRLTWAAISLEDVVYSVCRAIKPRHGPADDHPIGPRIAEALLDLEERPTDAMRESATAWLIEARGALEQRNAVLHSVPMTFVPLPDVGVPLAGEADFLTHFPKAENRPLVNTKVSASGFAPLRERLHLDPPVLVSVRSDRV